MAREEIRVDIVANDEASAEIEDVGKKADKLEADPVLVKVDADASAATAGMKQLGDTSDQTGSVMANMAGNAAQDLGALGGVAGTAGVAIGQLAEYATEGNISLGKLVQLAGPMLALGVATKVVSDHMAKAKAADAFSEDQVQGWVDAMREGATLTEAILDNYRSAGKVEVELGNDIVDLTRPLAELNLSVEEFADLQGKSEEEIRVWAAAMRDAGANTDAVTFVMAGAIASHDDLADATAIDAANAEVFGTGQEDVADSVERVTESVGAYITELDRLRNALDQEASYTSAIGDADTLAGSLERVAYMAALGMQGTEEFADAQRAATQDTEALKGTVIDLVEEYGTIPEEERTAILAELPENEQYLFSLWLAEVEAGATAPIRIDLSRFEEGLRRVRSSFGYIAAGGGAVPGFPGTTATTNITINAPRGTRPAELIAAGTAYARRNGRR